MLTSDTLFNGRLVINQEKKGYRFSLDAVLLAGLTRVKRSDRVMDLGTGSGVILLILAHRNLGSSLVGAEIQTRLAELARRNVEANRFSDQILILEADFRRIDSCLDRESFDLVLCNPPYRRLETGRINPDEQRAIARHELNASVEDVFAAAGYLLVQGGRLAVIYPASGLGRLLVTVNRHGFSPKELTAIHSYIGSPARLVCLECRKGGGEELSIAPPFVVYSENGAYTDSMQALYER